MCPKKMPIQRRRGGETCHVFLFPFPPMHLCDQCHIPCPSLILFFFYISILKPDYSISLLPMYIPYICVLSWWAFCNITYWVASPTFVRLAYLCMFCVLCTLLYPLLSFMVSDLENTFQHYHTQIGMPARLLGGGNSTTHWLVFV